MTKPNPAAKLVEAIVYLFTGFIHPQRKDEDIADVELLLQPTFDLLKRIHKLSEMNTKLPAITTPHSVLEAIEQLTREYDNLT